MFININDQLMPINGKQNSFIQKSLKDIQKGGKTVSTPDLEKLYEQALKTFPSKRGMGKGKSKRFSSLYQVIANYAGENEGVISPLGEMVSYDDNGVIIETSAGEMKRLSFRYSLVKHQD